MQKHTIKYFDYFDYGPEDFIPCEICGNRAVDIHHIKGRIGKNSNSIENLIGLCRGCHNDAHNVLYTDQQLILIHENFMK